MAYKILTQGFEDSRLVLVKSKPYQDLSLILYHSWEAKLLWRSSSRISESVWKEILRNLY